MPGSQTIWATVEQEEPKERSTAAEQKVLNAHPGFLVHLTLEVAEGPAHFGHTLSLVVAPQRAGLLLWYTGLKNTHKHRCCSPTAASTPHGFHNASIVLWKHLIASLVLYWTIKVLAALRVQRNTFLDEHSWTDLYASDPEVLEIDLMPEKKQERKWVELFFISVRG